MSAIFYPVWLLKMSMLLVDDAPKNRWSGEYYISIVFFGIVIVLVGLNWHNTLMKQIAKINVVFILQRL